MRNAFEYVLPLGFFLLAAMFISSRCTTSNTPDELPITPSSSTVTPVLIPTSTYTMIASESIGGLRPTAAETLSPSIVENTRCLPPSEDYSIVEVNGHFLNQRTLEMLAYAQTLYDGEIDMTGAAITQGSYTDAEEASFGTHAGGGAVDLSVMAPGTYNILYADIPNLIQALRLAGFAAWYRDFNELYEGSPPHIHAIAIGDRELSIAAREQLAGPFGYFWGYNGLPTEDKVPIRDPHSGPIVCEWMVDKGYPNKTATPGIGETIP